MAANDFITVGLPYPLTQTGKGSAIPLLTSGGGLTLTGPLVAPAASGPGSGLLAMPARLIEFRNTDGTVITASAAAGGFALLNTTGTSMTLKTEVANNNTKTDVAIYEFTLPASYVAGNNITVTVNAGYTIGGGTLSAKSLAAAAYLVANDGTEGSTLIATATATLTGANVDYPFVITGTTLVPGSRLILKLTTVLTETASSNTFANINSVRLS